MFSLGTEIAILVVAIAIAFMLGRLKIKPKEKNAGADPTIHVDYAPFSKMALSRLDRTELMEIAARLNIVVHQNTTKLELAEMISRVYRHRGSHQG